MKSWLRQFLAVLLLCVCLVVLYKLSPQLMSEKILSGDDFVEYWSAGQLNLRGGNPYGPEQLAPLQLQAGRHRDVPVMMWNPPWILPLIMPFGALDYPFSRLLWFLSQTAIVFFCASFIWRFYGGPPSRSWLAGLLAFSFFPTLFMLKVGQIPAVMLLGIVLFLMFCQRQKWWLAALSMLLMTLKPHTLYLVLLAYLFWAINQRRWALLASSGMGIFLATGIALLFNPMVLQQYVYTMTHRLPVQFATPTIGALLQYFLGVEKVWLQFVPAALGVTWFCFYWYKARLTWAWSDQMPLLVAVSVLTTSYAWTFDYVVLLLIILPVVSGLLQRGWNAVTFLAIGLYLAIDGLAFALNISGYIQDDFWFMWLAPALMGWYLLMLRLGVVKLRS